MSNIDRDEWFAPDVTTFGDRLTGAREHAGMSQEELSRRLGVKLETLKSWEDDLSEPRANKLSMMAGLLNVSLPWLLTGVGESYRFLGDLNFTTAELIQFKDELRDLKSQLSDSVERLSRLEATLEKAFITDIEDE
ncbi:MAG: helix-turn-helix transcriptional regulator [Roseovarius sp.]|nr:helix-turn-helix transcriptional regulator [Roseovarius sp.]MCY4208677.1 helix-turn-helix transcriptional regulator [Roseovarius sp.]